MRFFSEKIKKIYKKFEEEITSDIEYRQGLPTEKDFKSYPNDDQCIVVIDDMQASALNNFSLQIFLVENHIIKTLVLF